MKKFVVNSTVPGKEANASAWILGTKELLKKSGAKDTKFRTCYCCTKEGKIICEFDAPTKEALSESLQKIDFPIDAIMETEKVTA